MIDQKGVIRAIRHIGDGFLELSRALEGGDSKPVTKESLTAQVAELQCPECKGPMRLRFRKKDDKPFAGCRNFPACGGVRNLEDAEKVQADDEYADNEFSG